MQVTRRPVQPRGSLTAPRYVLEPLSPFHLHLPPSTRRSSLVPCFSPSPAGAAPPSAAAFVPCLSPSCLPPLRPFFCFLPLPRLSFLLPSAHGAPLDWNHPSAALHWSRHHPAALAHTGSAPASRDPARLDLFAQILAFTGNQRRSYVGFPFWMP